MKGKILTGVSILTAALFIFSGLNKVFNFVAPPADNPEAMNKLFTAFVESGWIMPLLAVSEVVGAVLLILPKYRALGAIILFPVMVGILLTHILNAPAGLPMAVILMAINIWIIYENREKYMPMIS
jgi:putative oxidoreductase